MADSSDADRLRHIEHIFHEALGRASEERDAYLSEACGDDADLLAEVERLLTLDTASGFDAPTQPVSSVGAIDVGESIGSYRLLEVLGEGGFGVVYLAEQREPVRRRVALKVVKPGMDSRAVIARFEAERQALAMMDHANVAHIYDAGTTPAAQGSRPYFVMELVEGPSITEHCDAHRVGVKERIKLLMRVCDAVQHAHQKGVIHRDLKPSNVLVGSDGQPKVIDFGVAKALHQKLTEKTIFTATHQLVGTPVYMSPEQAEGTPEGVDTRTDIYALGVLLYELLTGTPPFTLETLRRAGLDEIRRIIREEDPPRPSTRISEARTGGAASTGSSIADLADRRATDPRSLARTVRGDLDWVVMRCLEKDRNRRYQSSSELAAELDRFLHHEPILAGPPSTLYRARKFVRRNRALVSAGSVAVAALVVATGVSLGFAMSEARQRELASDQAAIAERINRFLTEDLLSQASPMQEARRDILLREVLDRASVSIEGAFEDRPLVEAGIRGTLGRTYLELGMAGIARDHFERALELTTQELGEARPETLETLQDVTEAYIALEMWDRGLETATRLLEQRTRVLGEDHPDTVAARHHYAVAVEAQGETQRALEILEECLAFDVEHLGPAHPRTLELLEDIAKIHLYVRMNADAALEYARQAMDASVAAYGEKHPAAMQSTRMVAQVHQFRAEWDTAMEIMEKVVALLDEVYGPRSLTALNAWNDLADLYKEAERPDEATAIWERVIEEITTYYGRDSAATALGNLGGHLTLRRELDRAIPLLEEAIERLTRLYGEDDSRTLMSVNDLAVAYNMSGRHDEAIEMQRRAIEVKERVFGPGHEQTVASRSNLVAALRDQERYEEALPIAEGNVPLWEDLRGPDHPYTLIGGVQSLGEVYLRLGRLEEAEALLRRAEAGVNALYGFDHRYTHNIVDLLAQTLRAQGRHDEAESWLIRMLESQRELRSPGHWETAETAWQLGTLYRDMGRLDESCAVMEQAWADLLQEEKPSNKQRRRLSSALAEVYGLRHAQEPGDGHDARAAEWRAARAGLDEEP